MTCCHIAFNRWLKWYSRCESKTWQVCHVAFHACLHEEIKPSADGSSAPGGAPISCATQLHCFITVVQRNCTVLSLLCNAIALFYHCCATQLHFLWMGSSMVKFVLFVIFLLILFPYVNSPKIRDYFVASSPGESYRFSVHGAMASETLEDILTKSAVDSKIRNQMAIRR